MEKIFIGFFVIYTVFVVYVGANLYKNLPNTKEKLKFVIPLLIAVGIGIFFYLNKVCFRNLP